MPTHHLRSRIAITLAALALVAGPAPAQEAPRSPTPPSSPIPGAPHRGRARPRAPLGPGVPARRPHARHREAGAAAPRRPRRTALPALTGVPEVLARGQGGLLDVALTRLRSGSARVPVLLRARTGGRGHGRRPRAPGRGRARRHPVIWRQEPKASGNNHWGSRLVFRPDGTLFVTLGDRFGQRERAQDLADHARQDRAHQRRRLGPARQPLRRPHRRASRDLVVRSPQRVRAPRSTGTASCGRWSTAPEAVTS